MAITMRPPASLEIEDMYYINASVQALSAQLVSTTIFPIEKMGQTLLASVKLLASHLEPTQPPVRVVVLLFVFVFVVCVCCLCLCFYLFPIPLRLGLLDPTKPHPTT